MNKEYQLLERTTIDLPAYPQRTENGELLFCLKGYVWIYINQQKYELSAGCVIMTFPEQIIFYSNATQDLKLTVFSFSKDFRNEIFYSLPSDKISFLREHNQSSFQDEEWNNILDYIQLLKQKCNDEKNTYQNEIIIYCCRMLFYEICNKSESTYSKTESSNLRCQLKDNFIASVITSFMEHRSVEYYADKLCVTTRHLSKTLQQTVGCSAKEWIDDYVILEIKVTLQTTALSIQEISNQFNFPDQSYFGRYFKHHTGMSPSAYREKSLDFNTKFK
ncbi:MAG: helix-turn-helix transcriptional regulator [Bacteroidota bacterium]|nr:helix-turn-helix transcriptional regulator [Bacteroidota bacterium]